MRGSRGTERLSDLPRITHLLHSRGRISKTYHICPPPLGKAAYPDFIVYSTTANVGCVCAELLFVARQARLSMGILQARILEQVAKPSSRGSSQPRDRTQGSHIAGGFFTV